jgi:hypothetical protein
LGQNEFISSEDEDFSIEMQKLHGEIKEQLQDNNTKYTRRSYENRKKVTFEVGDQVLAYLRKEWFLRGTYKKLKMKKIGPCKILRKIATNAYEIEMPDNVGISPTFNVAELYPYMEDERGG